MVQRQKTKDKEETLREIEGENGHLTYMGTNIRITTDFSSETCEQEENRMKYLKYWKKSTTNLEFWI